MDPLTDHASRLALEQQEATERRHQKLAEQAAATNSPGTRLRAWETFHALKLPSEPAHPLLETIARDTGLTFEEIAAEQQQRAAAATAKLAGAARKVWDPYCTQPDKNRG